MAEGKGIVRWVRAVFDRDAAKKMEGEFGDSLQKAGEQGGKKAGAATMAELRKEFEKKKAQLARDLASGVIDQKQWKAQTDAAARTFNDGVLRLMDQAKAKGADGEREFNKLGRSLKNVGDAGHQAFSRIRMAIVAAGAAAAFFAARALGQVFRQSIQDFEALRTGQRQLEQQLANTGIAYAEVTGEIKEHARALWDTHRLTEGEVQGTLRQLVLVTGDYQKSLRLVGLAHDLMAATGLGAEQATRLLGRAMSGELGALKRYGIQLDENRDVVEQLTERLNGSARAATSNAETWSKAMGDLRETIGGLITAAFGMDEGFSAAANAVRKLNDALTDHADEWSRVGRFVVLMTRTIGHSLWILAQSIGSAMSGIIGGVMLMLNQIPDTVNAVIRQLNRLPGVDIPVTMGRLPADRFFAEMQASNERVESSVQAIAAAWRDVGKEAERVRPAVTTPGGTPTGDPAGGGPTKEERDREAEALARLLEKQDAYVANLLREIDVLGRKATATLEGEDAVAALNRQLHIENALLQSGAEAGTEFAETIEHLAGAHWDAMEASRLASEAIQSDWATASEAVAEELNALGESAAGVFHAIATGGIAGLARLAKAKVIENIAWAIENTAKALGGLNPAAAAAAKTHMVAAAKWGAVGGMAAAIGGGGGGAAMGARLPSTGPANNAQPPGAEIHVHFAGEGFDAVNPRVQRVVYGAMERMQKRAGPNATVINRRTP
jgi:hypothetical protein